ncbi:MAG TPA: isoprenylcysteine carboxylmethyltransferase family protein [Chloroflexota bacterium]|nr:isoprenylcysteine carboxylmethyltransferase family protein [Chloroflexota bacterium]
MDSESPYRIAAGALLVVLAAVGAIFRLRAARSGEDLRPQRRQEGAPLLALRAALGILFIGAPLAYLADPPLLAWAAVPLPGWLRWSGAAVAAAGVPLLFWVLHTLGANLTDTVAIRRHHTLVTNGPYRWVRHPFYIAVTLEIAALGLLLASWPAALGLAGFWVYLWRRTPLEEAKLTERFGDAYREYAARTGRYFPRLQARRLLGGK